MTAIISMLRAVNLGGHQRIKMEALRTIYESLGLRDAQTYIQSGNVLFRTNERDMVKLAGRIENAIEKKSGFRPDVILRTAAELREVVERNPFAKRLGSAGSDSIDPRKLVVTFLARQPDAEARQKALSIKADPAELRLDGCNLYIYFPNGLARPNLSWTAVAKSLNTTGTARNWNTVTKLLELAERLEAAK